MLDASQPETTNEDSFGIATTPQLLNFGDITAAGSHDRSPVIKVTQTWLVGA